MILDIVATIPNKADNDNNDIRDGLEIMNDGESINENRTIYKPHFELILLVGMRDDFESVGNGNRDSRQRKYQNHIKKGWNKNSYRGKKNTNRWKILYWVSRRIMSRFKYSINGNQKEGMGQD